MLLFLGSRRLRQVDRRRLRYRGFALAPSFLRQDEIEERGGDRGDAQHVSTWPTWEAIAAAAKHSSVKEINDRKGYLAFKHRRERKTPGNVQ